MTPNSGAVDLWRIALDVEEGGEMLDDGERERAGRFRFEMHRRRFVAAHAAVRRILAGYTGGDPRTLEFVIGEHGKPELADGQVRFNLSHSGDVALCAVAAGDVGVDIEWQREDASDVEIAARFFAGPEAARVRERDGEARKAEFFRIWSAKEAFLKGTGAGLSMSPSSFELEFAGERIVGVRGREEWRICEVDAGEGWAAAVALCALELEVRWRT